MSIPLVEKVRINNEPNEGHVADIIEPNTDDNKNSSGNMGIKRLPLINWPSQHVEKYETILQVGQGSFGKVYKARLKSNPAVLMAEIEQKPQFYALKKILMENEKEGFPVTAIREIMCLKRLNHPNIVKFIDIVINPPSEKNKHKGDVFLVIEYMEHDLSGLIQRGILFEAPIIKYIMHSILQGLLYLHKNQILHRDIKTANILISNKGAVKLTDFGLARNFSPNPNAEVYYTNRVVTLWYRAPELLLGSNKYDSSVDMWSVG